MTDIELLPLYAELQGHPKIEIIKHYARACVAHATEPLRAHRERLTLYVLDLEADRSGLIASCDSYRRRAERLAEALRELVALGHPRDPAIIAAKNALRDHDQEVGNG